MNRRLSSYYTNALPYVVAVTYLPIATISVVTFNPSSPLWWGFILIFLVSIPVSLFVYPIPKQVFLTDNGLDITGIFRKTSVHVRFADIKDVTASWITQYVTINLRVDTCFGSRIGFIPKIKFFHPFLGHPDIQLLREKVKLAATQTGSSSSHLINGVNKDA